MFFSNKKRLFRSSVTVLPPCHALAGGNRFRNYCSMGQPLGNYSCHRDIPYDPVGEVFTKRYIQIIKNDYKRFRIFRNICNGKLRRNILPKSSVLLCYCSVVFKSCTADFSYSLYMFCLICTYEHLFICTYYHL